MSSEPTPQPKVGVWRAVAGLGDYKIKHLLWPEGIPAAVIGGGGAVLVARGTDVNARHDAAGTVLPLAGGLLAVVFAALAIVVAIPTSRYLAMLYQTPNGGLKRFLDPFLFAVGTQIAIVLLALGYTLGAGAVSWQLEHAAFYVLGFLFVYGLLDIAGLARSLVRHGINRAKDAMHEAVEEESGGQVRQLDPQRRGG
jgi:small-conductance mechanosensitive channel